MSKPKRSQLKKNLIGNENKKYLNLYNDKNQKYLYLTTGHLCNEDCVFCIMKGSEEKFPEMSLQEIKSIIKSFLKKGNNKSISLTGGEPTMRKDLPEIIEYACSFNSLSSISIITNGVCLADKNFVQRIVQADKQNKLTFCVSLHSHNQNISEEIVRRSKTFYKTIQGIQNIYLTRKRITIYQVITIHNYQFLKDFSIFLQKKFPNIKNITFAYPFPQGDVIKNPWIFINFSKLKPYLLNALLWLEKNNYDISIASCGQMPLCVMSGFEEKVINPLIFAEKNIIGSIGKSVFHEYTYGSQEFIQEYKNKSHECEHCLLNNYCQGFWKEYINIFKFEGIEPVTIENFSGQKIDTNLLNYIDFQSIINQLSHNKVTLILLNKYSDYYLRCLSNLIKKNNILGLIKIKDQSVVKNIDTALLSAYQKQPSDKKIVVMTGFSCNSNCSACSTKLMANKHSDRSTQEIKNDLIKGRNQGYEIVDMTGGEPTIRADILELIKFAKRLQYKKVEISTNGRMFSYKSFCQKAIESGLDRVTITINADTERIADAITRTAGSFNQTIQGIKNISQYPQVTIAAATTLTKLNYQRLPQIAKMINDLKMSYWGIADLIPDGNAKKFYKLFSLRMTDIAYHINKIEDFKERLTTIIFFDFPLCVFSIRFMNNTKTSFINTENKMEDLRQAGYDPRRFHKDSNQSYNDIYKRKIKACNKCEWSKNCAGVWIDYLNLHGEEKVEEELLSLINKNISTNI